MIVLVDFSVNFLGFSVELGNTEGEECVPSVCEVLGSIFKIPLILFPIFCFYFFLIQQQ